MEMEVNAGTDRSYDVKHWEFFALWIEAVLFGGVVAGAIVGSPLFALLSPG
jgi:hypothetical protein